MKTFLKRIDAWVGKNLFVPPIIAFCRATRQNQYEATGCFIIIACLIACWDTSRPPRSLVSYIWFSSFVFITIIAYITYFIRKVTGPMDRFTSVFSKIMLVLQVFLLLVFYIPMGSDENAYNTAFWVFAVAAIYASNIKNIPPRKKPQSQGSGKVSQART